MQNPYRSPEAREERKPELDITVVHRRIIEWIVDRSILLLAGFMGALFAVLVLSVIAKRWGLL